MGKKFQCSGAPPTTEPNKGSSDCDASDLPSITVMGNLAIVLLLVCIVSSYGAFPKHYPFPDFGSDIPCDRPYDLGKCHSNSSPPLV
ncbi:hypothetical protein ISCGN_026902 [Ixodes scapularis]